MGISCPARSVIIVAVVALVALVAVSYLGSSEPENVTGVYLGRNSSVRSERYSSILCLAGKTHVGGQMSAAIARSGGTNYISLET